MGKGILGEGLSFLDIISVLSFIIGLLNLELNQKQVDNLEMHLKEQDDNHLAKIIAQNEEIIKLLKEQANENAKKPN